MTYCTENNKVFNTTKILIMSALALIFNYAFIIGYTLVTVLLEYPGGITKCAGLQFKENQSKWVMIPTNIYYLMVTTSGIIADVALQRYYIHIALILSWNFQNSCFSWLKSLKTNKHNSCTFTRIIIIVEAHIS